MAPPLSRHNELTHRLLVPAAAPSRQSNVSTAPGVLIMPTDTYPTIPIRRPSTHPRLSHPILGYRGHPQNTGSCMTTATGYNGGPHRNSPSRGNDSTISPRTLNHTTRCSTAILYSHPRNTTDSPSPGLFDGCRWFLSHVLTSLSDARLNLAH